MIHQGDQDGMIGTERVGQLLGGAFEKMVQIFHDAEGFAQFTQQALWIQFPSEKYFFCCFLK